MQFSIIIPTLNEAIGIETCLNALQTLRPEAEIILVDGGSTDNTLNLAKPLVDKIIPTGKGRSRQMNAGAAEAKGEILIFLHADTFLPEQALQLIATGFKSGQKWGRFDIQLLGKSPLLKMISGFMNVRSRLTGIATGDQVIFIRRDLFKTIGGYPEIALMEDITLSARLKKQHPPLCLKAQVKSSARRWEEFGLLKIIILMWSLRLRYWLGESPEILAKLYAQGLIFKPPEFN